MSLGAWRLGSENITRTRVSESPPSLDVLRRLAAGAGATQADPRPADAWLADGPARAQLHEVYAAEPEDGPAALGFAAAMAVAARALPVLWIRTDADERQAGRLHATGLAELGLPPGALLLALVANEAALLRAAADAARCPGLGTVILESRGRAPGFDLTATRRLMLSAEASGVTVLSVRIGAEPQPSAAATRWGVAAAPSTPLEADAPGGPAFDIELLRRRGGPAGARWRVEWNRDETCFRQAPLAGAGVPLAPGGAPPRDAPAPVRASG